jgi:hypothetical protein
VIGGFVPNGTALVVLLLANRARCEATHENTLRSWPCLGSHAPVTVAAPRRKRAPGSGLPSPQGLARRHAQAHRSGRSKAAAASMIVLRPGSGGTTCRPR